MPNQKPKFTPGSRSVVENDTEGIHVLAEPHGVIIAEHFNSKSDADLDAAAPELFEALDEILDFFCDYENDYGTIPEMEAARAALRKALGAE